MARRRRSRGTWLPGYGTESAPEDDDAVLLGQGFNLDLPDGNGITTGIVPLTWDVPQEPTDGLVAVTTLSDVIGSEYVCKRVVGKFLASRTSDTVAISGRETDRNPAVLICAGLFVARADDANENMPIGSLGADPNQAYSPLHVDTAREPWMWRRSWVLGTQNVVWNAGTISGSSLQTAKQDQVAACWPSSTAAYGALGDGPHVDCRSQRRVSSDNRLFLAVSAVPFPVGNTYVQVEALGVYCWFDYRIFGSLRRAKNSSAF